MKVGLLTYHSAYNYGSVLQAYATQEIIKETGNEIEIINYRMKEQRRFYNLYRINYGIRFFIKDLMQLPVHNLRMNRCTKFEDFLLHYMNLTKECVEPSDVYNVWTDYDLIVSGSDQIWNKHSQELEHNSFEYMYPYLLRGFTGKKISYASSIGNMTDQELNEIIGDISAFDMISMREAPSAHRLSKLIEKPISTVLDPTFLLSKEEWIKKLQLQKEQGKYILFYGLLGLKPLKEIVRILRPIAKKKKCKLKVITPFAYINFNDDIVEMHPEYGPVEFLNQIYNAEQIYTSSYHGTILSVNLNKEIFSLCEHAGTEFRKTYILEKLGLKDRIIYDPEELLSKSFDNINYDVVNRKIMELRKSSKKYLMESISLNR